MNSRLQQFLELENLTPARLADILGVQRSGLSHILSGRNKPGYDFINKLLIKFPAISADWLLTGKGKPYKEMNNFPPPSTPQSSSPNFESIPKQLNNQQFVNQPILDKIDIFTNIEDEFNSDTLFSSINSNFTNNDRVTLNTENQSISNKKSISQLNENQINNSKQEVIRKKKNVKRVIIFYSDGSFEEMFPQPI